MRYIIFIIILIFLWNCSTNQHHLNEVELISYHWSLDKNSTIPVTNENFIKCNYYALIDDINNCTLIAERFYPQKSIKCFKFRVDKHQIDGILLNSKRVKEDILIRKPFNNSNFSLYDGPSIKLRINQNFIKKTFSFVDTYGDSAMSSFVHFFHYIDSVYMSGKLDTIRLDLNVMERRKQFLDYIASTDTIVTPLPPKAIEQNVKYKEPNN